MADSAPHPLVIRLLDVQRARGISGSELSRRLSIDPATWTRLQQGTIQPSLRVVQSAVAAFPELTSFCVELLMIRTSRHEGVQSRTSAEVA
jgi:transcriptional regulator with XRE-family HTH domain